jgi:hypothetical protein
MPDHAKALEYAQMEVRLAEANYNKNNPAITSTRVMLAQAYLDLHQQLAEARKEQQWQPIETAPKVSGKEIIGTRWAGGVCIREPFVSFWSPMLNKFYCDPTHYIPMACPPLDAMPAKEGV